MLRRLVAFCITFSLLTSFFSLWVTPVAKADNSWLIDRFHSNIVIQDDGLVAITETIRVDFKANKHGIVRHLPYRYQAAEGDDIYTDIELVSVQKDNINEPYTIEEDQYNLRLKIGDERVGDLKGVFTYKINYIVEGILRGHTGFDELYWNVTGDEWGVGINQATASVKLPQAGVVQQSCYQGVSDSTEVCSATVLANQEVRFAASRALGMEQGLTIAVGYDKDMVSLLTVAPPTVKDSLIKYWEVLASGIAAALIGLIAIVTLWYKRGRDWWWQTPGSLQNNPEQAILKPIGAGHPAVVEFTPPESLTPALIGLIKDQKADTLDITATIIDLASRGYLTITELDKTWAFGSKDYRLDRSTKTATDLYQYEQLLLNSLFGKKLQIKLSSLKNTFYQDLDKIKTQLYEEGQRQQFFVQSPPQITALYIGLAFALIIGGSFAAWFVNTVLHNGILLGLSLGLILPGAVLLIVANFMPQRTAHGRELWRRIQGYKLFISTAEQHRQQFFEQQNLFNQVLPYAIIFGLTKKFANAMDQIGYQPADPSWYSGTSAFNAVLFANNMGNLSQAMSTTIASAPSSSGSSGGGSSGGGFGGGGGGSW